MNTNTPRLLEAITRTALYLLIFLLPIFFLPFTPEILEFNKQYLVYALIIVALLAWLWRGMLERRWTLIRTPLDVPILCFWLIALISTLVSKDRAMSFFGSPERLSGGFIALTFYILFFFLIVNHFYDPLTLKRVCQLLGLGSGLAAIYFWVALLGRAALPEWLPAWNITAGSNVRFGIILLIPFILGFLFLLAQQNSSRERLSWGALTVLLFVTIVALGYTTVFITAVIACAFALVAAIKNLKEARIPVVSLLMAAGVIFLIFSIFGSFQFLTLSGLPAEVSLAQDTSWRITLETMKEGLGRALLGSGPATFSYDFSAHRPAALNLNPFWTLRFGLPASQAAELVATLGVLGTLALLFIAVSVLWMWKTTRTQEERSTFFFHGVSAVWLTLCAILFLSPFETLLWLFFFLFLALSCAGALLLPSAPRRAVTIAVDQNSSQLALAISFGAIVVTAVMLVLGIYLGRFYGAEVYLRQGLTASARGNLDQGLEKVSKAAALNRAQARYLLTLTDLQFRRAFHEAQKSAPDRNLAGGLVSAAVGSARRATERAPRSAFAWETLGALYSQVIPLAPEARSWAIDAYSRAIELEPVNPAFLVVRGNLYQSDKKTSEARQDFERALALKSDYAQAFSALSALEEAEANLDAAVVAQEKAAQFARGDLNVFYGLARLYFNRQQGEDLKNAETILAQILARNPDHANALFTLGSLREAQGNPVEALKNYRKAAKLNPQNEEVKKKISTLEGISE